MTAESTSESTSSVPRDNSHSPKRASSRWWSWLVIVLLVVVSLGLAGLAGRHAVAFGTGADESGYLHNARLLRDMNLEGAVRPVAGLPREALDRGTYQSLGFEVDPDLSRQMPTYPFGFPMALAVMETVVGEQRGIWCFMVLMVAALPLLVYRLGRDFGLQPTWALVAGVAVGASPLTLYVGFRPLSDLFSTVLGVAAMIGAGRAHRHYGWGLLTGALFSWAMLTRLPNGLLGLPIGVLLLLRWREWRWGWAVVGAIPGCVFLGWLNNRLYGSPFSSGYVVLAELFKAEYFAPTMAHFGRWIWVLLTPYLAGGFLLSIRWIREERGRIVVLWIWVAILLGFYAFYYHSHETWWYLRFIHPAFPAIALGGAWVWQKVGVWTAKRWGGAWCHLVLLVVLGLGASWLWRWDHILPDYSEPSEDVYVKLVDWAREHVQPDDVWVCMQTSGCLYYYTENPIARYEYLNTEKWATLQQAAKAANVTLYAPMLRFEFEDLNLLETQVPGAWEQVFETGDLRVYRLRN